MSEDVARSVDTEPLLEVRGLKKYFSQESDLLDRLLGGSNRVRAVDGVDLNLERGETLAVVGESGCGKSTLAETILKLETPTDGTIRFQGADITDLSSGQMRPYRRRMQIIFQDPLASLNPRKTVQEVLLTPMRVHGLEGSKRDRIERAKELLELVGLNPEHSNRYPHQFSGGQQQRIALARALAVEPDLLIADEPVSSLDVSVQAQMLNLLDSLQQDLGLSLLFITHDLRVVRNIADRVAVMYLGEVVESANVKQIFESPRHPYTKSLLSSVPRMKPENQSDRIILEGAVPSPLDPPSGCRFHTRCPAVIPPDGWAADQETFKQVLDYRSRLLSGDIDPEAVAQYLKSDDRRPDDDAVAEHIITTELGADHERLPDDVSSNLEAATRALVAGEASQLEQAVSRLPTSPCEGQSPDRSVASEGHEVFCHLYDPESPGEPHHSKL